MFRVPFRETFSIVIPRLLQDIFVIEFTSDYNASRFVENEHEQKIPRREIETLYEDYLSCVSTIF